MDLIANQKKILTYLSASQYDTETQLLKIFADAESLGRMITLVCPVMTSKRDNCLKSPRLPEKRIINYSIMLMIWKLLQIALHRGTKIT